MIDFLAYLGLRTFLCLINSLPFSLRFQFCGLLVKAGLFLQPRYKKIALKNISQVFPNKNNEEKKALLRESCNAIARFVVDSARLDTIDEKWAMEHVRFPKKEVFEALVRKYPETGFIIATGHLGSFELFGGLVALLGYPLCFVVRNFKLKRVDDWWVSVRERHGNKVIARSGAFTEVVHGLRNRRNVALLFDQNVKRNHAVFVDFLGRKAATTKAVALAALKTHNPVLVASLSYIGDEQYQINMDPCDFEDLYCDETKSVDEKVVEITADLTKKFEKMILNSPAEWFWFHRRWKTTPLGVKEDFYD